MAGTCQQRSQSASSSTPLLVVANRRVSDARRAGLPSDGTRIVAYSSALPASTPHTRLRYSGSSLPSSTPHPFPDRRPAGRRPPGNPGRAEELTRVLEATVNGPSDHGSRRQTCPRPPPHQSTRGVTGGTASIFHAVDGVAQRYHDLSEAPAPGVRAGRPGCKVVPRLPSRALRTGTRGAPGAGHQRGVDRVADPPLEAAQRFLAGLAIGQLVVVVGPAWAVLVADRGDRGHVDRVVEPAVAAQREPVDRPAAGGHLGRGGAVAGGEVVAAGEPEHLADVADHGAADDRA